MGKEGKGERGQGELGRREINWQASKSCLLSRSGKAREGGARAREVGKERNQLASSRKEVTGENKRGHLGMTRSILGRY